MSPSVYRGSNPDETPRARTLAHQHTVSTFGLAVVGIATAGPWWRDSDLSWPATTGFLVLAMAILVWNVAATRCWHRHPMAVCVDCLTDIPTDGAVQAPRYLRRLRVSHRKTSGKRVLAGTLVVVAALVGVNLDPPVVRWASAFLLVVWWMYEAYEAASERTHMRLAPWCPYCRGRGDDDSPPVATPTPDPVGTKVRT